MKQMVRGGLVVAMSMLVMFGGPGPAAAESVGTRLTGTEEVPLIATGAIGFFLGNIPPGDASLDYTLFFTGLEGPVLFAHIHAGQVGVNGGIMAFLCGGGGKPACPQAGAVTGTITAADITAQAAGQGVPAGAFAKFLALIRAGSAYANVHSNPFPGGEIRGQLR